MADTVNPQVPKGGPSSSTGEPAQKSEDTANWQQWSGAVFTNAKAGMAGVDKDKVKAVVYEMSKVNSDNILQVDDLDKHYRTTDTYCSDLRSGALDGAQDSAHFKNEERKQAQTQERIRKMQERAKILSASKIAGHTK